MLATVSNLYVYGPVVGPITEDHPLAATGSKGRTRARMWDDLLAAHLEGRIRATELRPSSYLGRGSQSVVGDRELPRAAAGKRVYLLGDPEQPHTFTHPDDVARMLVTVGADERAWGRTWHVPSNAPTTQHAVVDEVCDAMGVERVPVAPVPRGLLRMMGLASPTIRELPEAGGRLACTGNVRTGAHAVGVDHCRTGGHLPAEQRLGAHTHLTERGAA